MDTRPGIEKEVPKPGNEFLRYLTTQKKLIITGVAISTLLFVFIKYLYPYPDFFLDSYNYIDDAVTKRQVTYRPVGYAHFLRAIHSFSNSTGVVVFAQYLMFAISSVFFFFSCDYLFKMPGNLRRLAFFLMIINPVLLLQTNMISSDSLFCSLTVIWFTSCLWCIMKPNPYALVLQMISILCCFQLRYTALFYPALAVVFFVLARAEVLYKLAGACLTVAVIYCAVEWRKDAMEKGTGVRILTAFSGWQIANNVLCYYKDIHVDPDDLPEGECRIIDAYVKHDIDILCSKNVNSVGTHFLWTRTSPLRHYQVMRMKFFQTNYAQEWTESSVNLSEYAWAIIKQNPLAYVRYYMGRNFINFLLPPREVLENYYVGNAPLPPTTKEWFGFTIDKVECKYPGLQKIIIWPYPFLSLAVNFLNVSLLVWLAFLCIRYRMKANAGDWRILIAWSGFYFSYVVFCLFSTIVLLRYLDPLFILGMVMPFVLWQRIQSIAGNATP